MLMVGPNPSLSLPIPQPVQQCPKEHQHGPDGMEHIHPRASGVLLNLGLMFEHKIIV